MILDKDDNAMHPIDVLIVKPGSQKKLYGRLSTFELTGLEPPLWASLLAGYLRKLGYSVKLLDAEVEQLGYLQTAETIKEINPLLAVISVSGSNPSASTMNMTGATNIIAHLKELCPKIHTIFHGLHPSALPEQTMQLEKSDFVCEGEGFYTLPKLIDILKKKDDSFEKVDGLWYRSNDQIMSNKKPCVFESLDELPMPAWDLLPMEKYRAHNWHCFDNIESRQPYGVIYGSFGCPFKCSFCCINAIFGKPGIRYRSPQNIVGEIDYLVNTYGIRNIKITDEMFAINEKRVTNICNLIIERKYDLNMWAYARVNTVTPKMLDKMKQAGINWTGYGFEAGTKQTLKGINKGYDLDKVAQVVKQTYDAGIYIAANFIFGLPDDDWDSMQQTLDLAVEINAEWANFYCAMAYPGSQLYEQAIKDNLPLPQTWQAYSQYSYDSLPLPSKYLTTGEILSFRDYAFHAYFENPRYLNKINRVFGIQTVEHIKQITKHKLKRKYGQFNEKE